MINNFLQLMHNEKAFPSLDSADNHPVREDIEVITNFIKKFDILNFLNINQ